MISSVLMSLVLSIGNKYGMISIVCAQHGYTIVEDSVNIPEGESPRSTSLRAGSYRLVGIAC